MPGYGALSPLERRIVDFMISPNFNYNSASGHINAISKEFKMSTRLVKHNINHIAMKYCVNHRLYSTVIRILYLRAVELDIMPKCNEPV